MLPEAGFPSLTGPGYRDVLKGIERQLSAKWYLEIGSRSGTSLADRTCNFVAIDPEFALSANAFNASAAQLFFQEESDTFFQRGFLKAAGIVPDFAFIDGMHLIDYLLRDFRNTEAAMEPGGVISLHDVLPFNRAMTINDVGALDRITAWTGDVWKIIPILQRWRPDLKLKVVGAPKTGILVVRNLDPDNTALVDAKAEIDAAFLNTGLDDFGVQALFDSFDLVAPEAYIAEL